MMLSAHAARKHARLRHWLSGIMAALFVVCGMSAAQTASTLTPPIGRANSVIDLSGTGIGPFIGATGLVDPNTGTLMSGMGGFNARAQASFTRPANTTAYAFGQLVANSTTAGSVTPLSFTVARTAAGTGFIRRVKLSKTSTSLTNASFRVHLYRNSPTPSNGDGGTWLTTSSIYLGSLDVTMDRVFTDQSVGIGTPNVGSEILFDTATGSQVIYGLIEARAAYTPASGETFTATLETWPN